MPASGRKHRQTLKLGDKSGRKRTIHLPPTWLPPCGPQGLSWGHWLLPLAGGSLVGQGGLQGPGLPRQWVCF